MKINSYAKIIQRTSFYVMMV